MAAKKKVKKKSVKKEVSEEKPSKKVLEKENAQLIWFIVFIVVSDLNCEWIAFFTDHYSFQLKASDFDRGRCRK